MVEIFTAINVYFEKFGIVNQEQQKYDRNKYLGSSVYLKILG